MVLSPLDEKWTYQWTISSVLSSVSHFAFIDLSFNLLRLLAATMSATETGHNPLLGTHKC
jgi:hypothetical protein